VGLFLDGAIPPDIALLTFGSPLGSLYRRFFPLHFTELDALGRQISGRWINLFREDDPVGGPVGEGIDRSPMEDRHGWIHGGYWHEPEYRQAVEELHRAVSSSGG
jgi:RimJ/RimL family protein N-acetyltransferase